MHAILPFIGAVAMALGYYAQRKYVRTGENDLGFENLIKVAAVGIVSTIVAYNKNPTHLEILGLIWLVFILSVYLGKRIYTHFYNISL